MAKTESIWPSSRRFTVLELTAYVSLAAFAFGSLQAMTGMEQSNTPILRAAGAVLGIAAVTILCALLGIAIAFMLGGRGYALAGAVAGGLGVHLVLIVVTFIIVYTTHR